MSQEMHQRAQPPPEAAAAYRAPDVVPALRYRNPRAAIEWLERAFGFERHFVVEDDDGTIVHAELRFGSGIVMLGWSRDDEFNVRTPGELGATTGGIYVVVDDPDAHYRRARSAGAEVVMELTDMDYGSRDYAARDPEGHLWHFGTYRPSGG